MPDLNRDLARLVARNRDDSYETRAARAQILDLCAFELHQMGYRNIRAHQLKPKHIQALLDNWTSDERKKFTRNYVHGVNKPWTTATALSPATLKNRMSHLRWLAEKLNKPQLVVADNTHYGIPNRVYVSNESKARELDDAKLARLKDEANELRQSVADLPRPAPEWLKAEANGASPSVADLPKPVQRRLKTERRATQLDHIVMSLKLGAAFGLRREESIKIVPTWAAQNADGQQVAPEQATHLWLKASWCKGGRERRVPIRTDEQRATLFEALALTGPDKALIPQHLPEGRRYIAQRNAYDAACRRVGLDHMHGLRHRYAQQRYQELVGWEAPVNGGPVASAMNPLDRAADERARLTISRELGHSRLAIVGAYLGGRRRPS